MRHLLERAAILSLLLLAAACASTVQDTWTDPSVAGKPLGFHKVATIARLEEGAMRRVAEDEMAKAIETRAAATDVAVDAVASYTVLAANELADPEQARAKLAADGFDGAVVVSVVDSHQRVTSTPDVAMTRWGYGGPWVMPGVQDIRTDTIVRVQTNIYALAEGKLVWSGTSQTLNPRDVSDLIDDVMRDVGTALRDQGLIR